MRTRTRILSLLLIGAVLGLGAGFGTWQAAAAGGAEEETPAPDEFRAISIAGAGSAGTFYVMASGFADLLNTEMDLNAVAEVTAGSVENARLIDSRQVEFGVMQLDVAQSARAGENQFENEKQLMAVTPMYPNVVQIVTLADSPIEEFADLEGKRVSVGSPGSGILATNEVIFETLGMSFDDIRPEYLSFAETTTAFRDDAVDAVIVNTAAPSPFLMDLETTHDLKMIPLSDEEIEAFTETFPHYVKETIPAGAYETIDYDTPTFAVWITLMTYQDMPEDVVYDVVRTIHENNERLRDVHVVSQYVTSENVPAISGVPYHPGAIRYYEEQGVDVPAY